MMLNKLLTKYFDTDSSELLSKSISYLIIRVLGTIFTFGFSYYVIKEYSSSTYGLISLAFSFFLILSVIGRLGLDINIVKHFSINNKSDDCGLFFQSLFFSFIFTSFLCLIIYWQSDYIVNRIFEKPKPELLPYLNWVLPSIPFWSITLISAHYLRAKKLNNWFVFFNSSSRFLFSLIFILILSLLISNDSLIVVKAHLISIILLSILSTFIAMVRLKKLTIKSKMKIFYFIKESLPIMYSSTTNMFINWIGIFILGIYTTSQEIGIFEISVKISLLLTFISQALNSILAPKIAQKYFEKDYSGFQSLVRLTTRVNFVSSLVLTFVILIFHRQLLGLFGEEFKDSFILLTILCLSQLIGAYCGSVGIILQMTGKQTIYHYLMVFALVILLIAMFVLIPLYGGNGAAISIFISMISWNVLGTIYIKRKMNFISYFR